MATVDAITEAFRTLRANGVRGGPPSGSDAEAKDARLRAVKTWAALLQDISDEQLSQAVMAYLRDPTVCQWWPQPGLLLARVPERRAALIDTADEAWGVLMRLAQVHGWVPPSPTTWSLDEAAQSRGLSPAGMAAGLRAVGGLRQLGMTQESELGFHRNAFRAAYRSANERDYISQETMALGGGDLLQLADHVAKRLSVGGGSR